MGTSEKNVNQFVREKIRWLKKYGIYERYVNNWANHGNKYKTNFFADIERAFSDEEIGFNSLKKGWDWYDSEEGVYWWYDKFHEISNRIRKKNKKC